MFGFIATHIFWVLGLIGGFGGVGVVVAIVVFGVPAALIVLKVVDFFKAVLEFFSTPQGAALAIVALAALCLFIGDVHARREDAKEWVKKEAKINAQWQQKVNEAAAKFKEARVQRDTDVGNDIGTLVAQQKTQIDELQQKVDTYEGADHPGCVLTPADLDGVRGEQRKVPAAAAKPKRTQPKWWDFIGNGR